MSNDQLLEQIKEQGDLVRKLKAAKEPKDKVSGAIIAVTKWTAFHCLACCYCCIIEFMRIFAMETRENLRLDTTMQQKTMSTFIFGNSTFTFTPYFVE